MMVGGKGRFDRLLARCDGRAKQLQLMVLNAQEDAPREMTDMFFLKAAPTVSGPELGLPAHPQDFALGPCFLSEWESGCRL